MDAGLIARRYATVLRDYAQGRGKLDEVYADVTKVRLALAENPEAEQFFVSPVVKPSEKKALLEGTFKGKVCDEVLQFLTFLVDKERIGLAGSILFVFEMLYKREKNICTATVTTAKELSAADQSRFVGVIADKMRKSGREVADVDATFRVDPSIIGGVVLAVDGKQVDDSVSSKLRELQRQLAE